MVADETKPSFKTTELLTMLGIVAAILIAAASANNFDAPRAWTLVAVVASAYMISRGLAKSGSRHVETRPLRRSKQSKAAVGAFRRSDRRMYPKIGEGDMSEPTSGRADEDNQDREQELDDSAKSSDQAKRREAEMEETGEENAA